MPHQAPPATVATLNAKLYWQACRRLSFSLFGLWLLATCAVILYADDFQGTSLLGEPLSFFLLSQGLLLFFVGINIVYAWQMRRLNQRYGQRRQAEAEQG